MPASWKSGPQASAPGGHLLGKGQSVCQVHPPDSAVGYKDKVSNHSRVKIKNGYRESIGTHALKFMGVHDQRTSKVQPAPGSLRSVNLPKACFFNFEHGPSVHTAHIEISQLVQKHLQSKLSDQPCWTPPAVNYISKPLNCKICNDTINGVDSLIVCDTCEKGFHLRCLHAIDTKSIATGEWHCPTCSVPSQGEPLQKYVGGISSGATDGVKVQYVMPVSQADPLNLQPRHQPSHGLISAPSTCSADDKISLLVWKYVQPKLPEHPTWTPVKDYISKRTRFKREELCGYIINNNGNGGTELRESLQVLCEDNETGSKWDVVNWLYFNPCKREGRIKRIEGKKKHNFATLRRQKKNS
ncbi:PHD finger protein [Acorus calamus]|uniref:PHD finger protein n=1 Tax=Acorus calamus TaxID=4465 RepID=A0AAV9D4T9_ACOCL|nr:PHD finger protein [Acorus calamus]